MGTPRQRRLLVTIAIGGAALLALMQLRRRWVHIRPVRALLERVRNEAHRFAIAYHRKERGKIRSRLDSIDGVGAVRRKALLRRFGSVQGIEKASVEELASVPGIGPDLAAKIKAQLAARER